jgi:hypothetical protein
LKEAYTWRDIIEWRDQIGIKRGIIFDEDGSIIFEEWPDPPHDQIVGVFSGMFDRQFIATYENQAEIDPVFEVDGTTGNNLLLQSRFDIQDMWLPGKRKPPDQAFRPYPRPANPATAALIQMQPVLGHPWPTIILEVGNSQGVPQLVDIRDRALGWKTQINVFAGIAYNRNQTRATDSWWARVTVRDTNANPPAAHSPNTYPPETAKVRYPKVETPLVGNTIWSVPTALLYHPEPVRVLKPPLPASFDFDVDRIRRAIERNRAP